MASPDAEAELAAIYASLPRIDCQRRCQDTCGPIVMSAPEWERLTSQHGERTCADDLVCPYLDRGSGLCGAYEVRPLACRLGGVAASLRCRFGCEPERVLSESDVEAVVARVQALSGGVVRSVWPGWRRQLDGADA
jgi:hypothetical protein